MNCMKIEINESLGWVGYSLPSFFQKCYIYLREIKADNIKKCYIASVTSGSQGFNLSIPYGISCCHVLSLFCFWIYSIYEKY